MKNTITIRRFMALWSLPAVVAAATLWPASTASARPYAANLTNDAGTISFRLNESADSVRVISYDGTVTNDLGALGAGLHTVALGVTGPFKIEVFKAAGPGYATAIGPNRGAVLQISTDNNSLRFNQARGLVVNTDPRSPYFGRVYLANGAAGTAGTRNTGDGIYMFNADLSDAVGQGNTARTGGLDFTTGATVSPYRLSIGEDGQLYVTDWSDTTGSLYVTDPDVSAGSGRNVLGGPVGSPFPVGTNRIHGSIAAAIVTGSLANSNLVAWVIDEDLQPDRTSGTANARNSFWRHDIGNVLPGPNVMPTLLRNGLTHWINFASQTMDLSRGTNGYFYVNNYRSVGSDRSGVTVLDTNGTNVLWSSLPASRAFTGNATENDLLRATGGGAVSPRGDYIALINIETNGLTVVPLIDGLPDLTNRLYFHGMGSAVGQGRDVAFDIAGNVYAIGTNGNAQFMRVFSPGGAATTVTGSDGTFEVFVPASTVRVAAEDAEGSEDGINTITFNIWRDGNTDAALTITYRLSGTASNGVDYVGDAQTTIIPAGATNVTVVITPVEDGLGEGPETVVLTLLSTVEYNIGSPAQATGIITDNEAALSVAAVDSEGNEDGDPIVFNIWRSGDGAVSPVVVNYALRGTATNGADYVTDLLTTTIPAGETNIHVVITPIDDYEAEFAETVILSLVTAAHYTIVAPTNALGVIGDNEIATISITSTGIDPYERFATNGNTFTFTRRGLTNSDVFVIFEYAGSATRDFDYVDPVVLYITNGMVTTNLTISPVDDSVYEGNETVMLTLLPNDYTVGEPASATTTIIDNECPPESVLFADNFTTDSSANWILRFGANNNVSDYIANFAFDYSTYGIPPAPGSTDSMGVRLSVNKNDAVASSAGINLYPANQNFSGDFALRFDLYLSAGNSNVTEHTLAGINHSGLKTNRVSQTPANPISTAGADGVFFGIETGAGNLRDYAAYTSTNPATVPALLATRAATTLANVITRPPYTYVGSPGNASNSVTRTWAEVEISQRGNIVALAVNKRNILSITNNSGFNSGNVMIGYSDQFESLGSAFNFAIFDNVRVVRLGIAITDIDVSGSSVQIDFTSSDGEQAGDFIIETSEVLSSNPADWSNAGAMITPNGNGFRATLDAAGDRRFYRVRK